MVVDPARYGSIGVDGLLDRCRLEFLRSGEAWGRMQHRESKVVAAGCAFILAVRPFGALYVRGHALHAAFSYGKAREL